MMRTFISLFALLFSIFILACQDTSSKVEHYICQCIENPEITRSDTTMTKKKYIFLVKGTGDKIDCCSSSLAKNYPGFIEIWKNNPPGQTDVWGMEEGAEKKTSAEEARKLGCSLERKETVLIPLSDTLSSREFVKQYYPKLAEQ